MILFDRIKFERSTVSRMITCFCQRNHDGHPICGKCLALQNYTFERIEKCPLHPNKPTCSNCYIHCYKPDMRGEIRKIMRFSGPRMLYLHSIRTITYLIIKKRISFAKQALV